MIQFALGASAIKEAGGLLSIIVDSPETYKKIEGLRQFIEKVTGKSIDKNGLVALLEENVCGEPFTGKWETFGGETARRLRVDGGFIYDIGHGNPIHVPDPK